MPKDILLYGPIWENNARYFFEQIKEALEDDPESELILRVNCEGGNPELSMGVILKVQEMGDKMSVIVDGQAHSMAAFLCAYVKNVSAIDTAQFVFHRAAYNEWLETLPSFEGSTQAQTLDLTNKDLEKALRAAIDVEKFESLPQMKDKGITIKKLFSMDDRIEVLLDAKDMKKVGLVKNIIKITPQKAAQIDKIFKAASETNTIEGLRKAAQITEPEEKPKEEPKKVAMTLAEFKAQHPAIYAEAKAEGVNEGTINERDRAGAWLAWHKVDVEAVIKGVKEGKLMSATESSEFTVKAASAAMLGSLEKGNTKKVETGQVATEQTEAEKKAAEFSGAVDKVLGRNKK